MSKARAFGALAPLVALPIVACTIAAPAPTPADRPSPPETQVTILSAAYAPADVTIPTGGQVRWTNHDQALHTVTFADGVDSSMMSRNSTFTRGFPTAGTFPYHCTTHPSVHGTVTVTPSGLEDHTTATVERPQRAAFTHRLGLPASPGGV